MKKNIILAFAVIALIGSGSLLAEVLTTGADFLKITPGGRNVAMGEAAGALTEDVEALNVNAAGLARLSFLQFFYEHAEWFGNVRYESLSAGVPLKIFSPGHLNMGTLAVNLQYLYTSLDQVDTWGLPLGNITYSSYKLSLGYGLPLVDTRSFQLSLGAAFSVIGKNISDIQNATLPSMDAGLLAAINPSASKNFLNSFRFSVIAQNVNFMNAGMNDNLPFLLKFGIGMKMLNMINVGVEALKYIDTPLRYNAGVEFWIKDIVALRAGTMLGGDDQMGHFSTGIGIQYKTSKAGFHLDYALVPFEGYSLLTHRFSVKVDLNNVEIKGPPDMTSIYYYKGVDYFLHNKYELAIQMWEKVLKKNPDNADAKARIEEAQKILKLEQQQSEMNKLEEKIAPKDEKKTK